MPATSTCSGRPSRITLDGDQLHPRRARRRSPRPALADEIRRNPYRSIVAAGGRAGPRRRPRRSTSSTPTSHPSGRRAPGQPGPGVAAWATEAPRGLLFHRYELDEDGRSRPPRIVPPTSQNQAAIEADLAAFAPSVLDLPHGRGDAPTRAADPELRPVHHVRDPLPGPLASEHGREPLPAPPSDSSSAATPDRGDDGAPLAAVAPLLPSLPSHLLGATWTSDAASSSSSTDLIDAADGARPASSSTPRSAFEPGAGRRRSRSTELPARDAAVGPVPRSSHALPIGQIVGDRGGHARATRSRGSLVAIGGTSFGFGPGLARPVRRHWPRSRTPSSRC